MKINSLLCLAAALILPACNSQTKAALQDAATVIGQDEVQSIANGFQQDVAAGGKVNTTNLAFSAVMGLFSGVSQAVNNGDASTIIQSFSAGQLPNTAKAAASVPVNNQSLAAVATVISALAGAPPAK